MQSFSYYHVRTLDEGVADWVFTYQLMKRLAQPFNKWEAYKSGLIDDDGKLLRKPTKDDRKTHWGYFDRVCWNIKKIIMQFTGKSTLSAALVGLYLLKEGIQTQQPDEIISKLFDSKDIEESKKLDKDFISEEYLKIKTELI